MPMSNFFRWFWRKNEPKTKRPISQIPPPPPPYLPAQRKRALSLPLPEVEIGTAIHQCTSPQTRSHFLTRLPLELRLSIYEEVFGGRTIHVDLNYGGRDFRNRSKEWCWWHFVCQRHEEMPDSRWWLDSCLDDFKRTNRRNLRQERLDISIIFACRQVYSESINVLYSTTTFYFSTHSMFLQLPRFIIPQRLSSITSIKMQWIILPPDDPTLSIGALNAYDFLWEKLASLPDLRQLRVQIRALECPEPVPTNLEEAWLAPLDRLAASRLQVFEFVVPETYFSKLSRADGEESDVYRLLEGPQDRIYYCSFP